MKLIRTEDAAGQVLCHDITQIIKGVTKDAVFRKGHIITEEDIPVLLSVGKDNIYIWEKDDTMLHENEAAQILYDICKNDHMHPSDVKEGKIELIAECDGLLKVDTERLNAVNALGEMMIACRHGNFPVKKGDKIAGTRIIPLVIEKEKMAQAWLMTDKINNQIIGFYPGAMIHKPIIPENTPNLWHLSPDYTHNMLFLAKQATVLNKKYFLDPGQDIVNLLNHIDTEPSMDSFSFREAISHASGLFVNEYEGLLIKNKLGLDNFYTELFNHTKLEFIVETLGSKGSLLILKDTHKIFHVTKADKVVDPTGCGDSFRAGFISEYLKSGNLEKSVQLGTVLASFAIEHFGGQNHKPTLKDITERLLIS